MYRQVNSERNAKFLDQCDMPRHIVELMYKLRQQEEMERRRKEMDRCMCKVRVVKSMQRSKLTGVLLSVACKIWLGQINSLGQMPQWTTGFLYAGLLQGLLDLKAKNENLN